MIHSGLRSFLRVKEEGLSQVILIRSVDALCIRHKGVS